MQIYFKLWNVNRRELRMELCPVVGRSRPAVIACRTVRSGVFHHWIHHLWPQGAVPLGFNPLRRGWVLSPGAWGAPKRGMPTGSEAFLELPAALGFGPAIGPTLKTALCHIRTLVGRRINNGNRINKPKGSTQWFFFKTVKLQIKDGETDRSIKGW